jgi:hypothetical protein
MATTTNYSWTTPDDTALVKDGAAAIRSLGTAIDTTTKALNPETTLGDLAYRSSTANVKTRLALGTAGQVLQVNSGATAPEWATPPSSVPANASATVATNEGTTSTSYTDLTTAGPAVTVTTGTKALVIITAYINAAADGFTGVSAFMSYGVTGATTSAAADDRAIINQTPTGDNNNNRMSAASVVTLTAGSNTFTSKYRSSASRIVNFSNREIFVITLA